jgi:hypothetical protein
MGFMEVSDTVFEMRREVGRWEVGEQRRWGA